MLFDIIRLLFIIPSSVSNWKGNLFEIDESRKIPECDTDRFLNCQKVNKLYSSVILIPNFILGKYLLGLNFINVLRSAFTHVDPESVRIQSNPQYLFMLLGSTCAKAARRMLMKLTPGVNLTNMFTSNFYSCNSQKRKKKTDALTVFFAFLVSEFVCKCWA